MTRRHCDRCDAAFDTPNDAIALSSLFISEENGRRVGPLRVVVQLEEQDADEMWNDLDLCEECFEEALEQAAQLARERRLSAKGWGA